MKVITDHKWHDFKDRWNVPKKILKDNFSHLNEDDSPDLFFKYKNWWYHASDFMRMEGIQHSKEFKKWDGYTSDTFFSGVLIKLDEDCERYMVGMYYA